MKAAPPPHRVSIVWKLTLFVAALAVLIGGAFSGAGYIIARGILHGQIEDRLTIVAAGRQALLLNFIEQQKERVSLVTSRTRLRQLLADQAAGKIADEEFRTESRKILLDAQKSTGGFLGIWIVGPDGQVLTATDDARLGGDFSDDADFQLGSREKTLGAPRAAGDGFEAIAAAPITSADDQPRGVCMVLLDATPMARLLGDPAGLGQTGEVVIATRVGETIHYLLPLRSGRPLPDLAPAQAPAMTRATAGQSGFTDTVSFQGRPVSAAYRPVGYRDWGLLARIDSDEAYAPIARLRSVLLLLGLGFLVVVAAGARLGATRFTRPVLALAETASAVAAGQLDARVNIPAGDELGTLGATFNRMTAQLADSYAALQRRIAERGRVVETIRGVVAQLSTTSRQLLATTAMQAGGAKEQESGVAETVTTMQEITHTAGQSADWAGHVGADAESAVALGRDGSEAVQDSIAAMHTVEREVAAITAQIQALADAARAIGDIIQAVNELSDQTNLLAVNASIEAARAGEVGKGFAVVAGEMRHLSGQSRQATAQVRRILAEIEKATAAAVLSGARGLAAAASASGVVGRAGETIHALGEKLAANAHTAAQIAATAHQQSTGLGQASAALQNILRVAQQNVTAIGQAETAAQHLQQLSAQLTALTTET